MCAIPLFSFLEATYLGSWDRNFVCVCEDSNPLPQRDEDQMGGGKEKKKKKLGIEFV